jgi:sugar transferase (PEP-CTERM system associated)
MIRVFNHYIPAQIFVLILIEALLLGLSIYSGASIRFGEIDLLLKPSGQAFTPVATVFALLMLMSMATFGLYQRDQMESFSGLFLRLSASFAAGFGTMSLLFYLVPELYLGRGAFAIAFSLAFVAIFLNRLIFYKWAHLGILKPRILVLGTGTRADDVEALASSNGNGGRGSNIIGYFPVKGGQQQKVAVSRIIAEEEMSLCSMVEKYNVNEIVLAVGERRGGVLPLQELLECRLRGVRITELSSFFERERGQLRLDSLNASWLILGEGFRNNAWRDVVKRAFDLAASAVLVCVTFPVMVLTALLIRLDSAGPVLYRQERVGQGGRIFRVYKFRSMCVDAEHDGQPRWAASDDGRTTRVGRWIRKLRIDELPQILNVLKGDMSFVGPRPERPYFVQQLAQEIPYYEARHSLKPGITGWAQVRYSYGASVEDAKEKLQYDLYYVKNHSLFLDVMILFDTIQVVLWGKGAR